ncbi:MAG TPA: hypothetical protein VFO76_06360, partial [Candidatus Kapabacteria bacterium]|nr:hypothetical protein [Candidatus Kapabacteria bacterium]
MMPILSRFCRYIRSRQLYGLSIAFVILFAHISYGQSTQNWRVIQRGSSGTPTIILPAKGASPLSKTATPQSTNGKQVLPQTILNEVTYSVLGLPTQCILSQGVSASAGNSTDFVYTASYNGIHIQDRYLKITVGVINNQILTIRNSIPNYLPDVSIPSIP